MFIDVAQVMTYLQLDLTKTGLSYLKAGQAKGLPITPLNVLLKIQFEKRFKIFPEHLAKQGTETLQN